MALGRRLRGVLLRLVLNRGAAVAAGVLVGAPGVVLLAGEYRWESPLSDGLALLSTATGVALAWAGVSGRRPDWLA